MGGKPTCIQKYDSVYLEPLNPDYGPVSRKSQHVFSSNGENMHEKACGPAEDNTDFSKEEFVIETEGLGELETPSMIVTKHPTMGMDIYAKKTEAKPLLHTEKGRSIVQKRNYDI
jgi:hypothetical protein